MAYKGKNGQFAVVPQKENLTREKTGNQADSYGLTDKTWTYGLLLAANGIMKNSDLFATNPLLFPGYHSLYTGTYATYRWMLQHPTLRLVRSIAVSPILASKWEYHKDNPSVPDKDVELVTRTFDKLRSTLLNDFFIRGRDYGWAGGELIWETRKAETTIVDVKPVLQDATEVLQDDAGNPTGLRNYVTRGNQSYVDIAFPFKAWKYTYDSEARYPYGRSWLENVRATAWRDWLDAAQQLQKLGAKISGTVTVITSPAGTFPAPGGKGGTISWKENAETVIKALANGAAGAWFPTIGINIDVTGRMDVARAMAELVNKSLVDIKPLDFGSHAPAIAGLLQRMQHDEELMFQGGLRPSRSGLEGKHGTKADAKEFSDTGITNAQLDDVDFACQCQSLVDALLVVNRGESARGTVKIHTPSLIDWKPDTVLKLWLAMLNDPATAEEFLDASDTDDHFKTLGLKMKRPFDAKKLSEIRTRNAPKPPGNVDPEGGRPKENE